jgi:ADP-ribosyl-[dinitrogen reductase] hydrolase
MRLAAVPVCFHDNIDVGRQVARGQSITTHQGEEAAELCELMTFIIVHAINSESGSVDAQSFLDQTVTTALFTSREPSVNALINSQQEGSDPNRNWNWKVCLSIKPNRLLGTHV